MQAADTKTNVPELGAPSAMSLDRPNSPKAADVPAHAIVPDYELIERIGSGAYGEVWLARSVLGQLRAVKVIYRNRFADSRPFEREFEGIQRFEPISGSHPSQLAILHVGRNATDGYFYYVMELADNASEPSSGLTGAPYVPRTLRHDIETRGRLPIADCVQVGLSLATALNHLHRNCLVHRDIKPSNVIFVKGIAKLGDIGLVTEAGDTQSIVGTEGYLPLEGPGTPTADIFSLGKVLYEISTGLDRRRFPELPPEMRSWTDYGDAIQFNEIVLRSCATVAPQRYATAEELRVDLRRVGDGKLVRRKRVWKNPFVLSGLAALVLAILLLRLVGLDAARTWSRGNNYLVSPSDEIENLVSQGHELIRLESPLQIETAIEKFKAATNLAPDFAPAYNGLFHAFVHLEGSVGVQGLRDMMTKLNELRPASSEAMQASAFIKWMDWDYAGAIREGGRAVSLPAFSKEGDAYKYLELGFLPQYDFVWVVGSGSGRLNFR